MHCGTNRGLTLGPFFNQPIVVSLHAGELQIRVGELAEALPGQSGDSRIENGIINSVRIHSLETLARIVGGPRYFFPSPRTRRMLPQRRAVDRPALDAVALNFDTGYSIAPFFPGHASSPNLTMLLHVIIRADQSVFELHDRYSKR